MTKYLTNSIEYITSGNLKMADLINNDYRLLSVLQMSINDAGLILCFLQIVKTLSSPNPIFIPSLYNTERSL